MEPNNIIAKLLAKEENEQVENQVQHSIKANRVWDKQGNAYFPSEITNQKSKIPIGIYKLGLHPIKGFYLEYTHDKFDFPYKIYGTETDFINRVVKTYKNTKSNLGILLNGVKGTGKTVTGEIICNKLKLPVIIINNNFQGVGGINNFVNDLRQDVILLFDEYEKIYQNYDYSILTVMDGVFNNDYRKVFVLTTNNTYINENMLQRPGRLRYVKTFDDLSIEAITEIVDDMLIHVKFKNEIVAFVSTLEIITVDIVKAIIEEVNIHKQSPQKFENVFNVKSSKDNYTVSYVKGDKLITKYVESKVTPKTFSSREINQTFRVNGAPIGEIKSILAEDTIIIQLNDNMIEEYDEHDNPIDIVTYKIEKKEKKHKSFMDYVF